MEYNQDTIVALATSEGEGSISIIRISGSNSIKITNKIFKGKDLAKQSPNTFHFGKIYDNHELIDEVIALVYRAPHSYTKEDSIEICCHSSSYIIKKIINLLIKEGARYADRGEFTKRAFFNGRYDLVQAESVLDIINSNSKTSHELAFRNIKGEFSFKLKNIREKLIDFVSLLELELDFSEEDLEFVDRSKLSKFLNNIIKLFDPIIKGFMFSNVIKKGIPIAIVGNPNVGKSTLLNNLTGEERSIVSEIPGTTRDYIEDTIIINDILFRITDTAGLRKTNDKVEALGIKKTYEKIEKAFLILYVVDLESDSIKSIVDQVEVLKKYNNNILIIGNKLDIAQPNSLDFFKDSGLRYVLVSAKKNLNIEDLKNNILKFANIHNDYKTSILSINSRHYDCLFKCKSILYKIQKDISSNLETELIISEIKNALNYLGEITGEITTDELLKNIFLNFCVGK